MTIQERNKQAMRRAYEAFTSGQMAVLDEVLSTGYVGHNLPPDTPPGPATVKETIGLYRAAFPDATFTVDDLLADGDKVIARITFRGTHRGPLMGIPPTNRQVTSTAIDILRFENGQGVELWGVFDQAGLMQQLGFAAATPAHA